jgi:V8-like Glu-specific endopeptidase
MSKRSAAFLHPAHLLAASFLFAAVVLAGPAALAVERATTAITAEQSEDSQFTATAPEAFWTQQRVKAAKPLAFYDDDADLAKGKGPEVPPVAGPPGLTAGGRPKLKAPAPPVTSSDTAAGTAQAENALLGTQNVGDNTFLNLQTPLWFQYPWQTIGKVFFTTADGSGSYCSASVISGNSIIVTAAHCCWDRGVGRPNRNFTFAPAMRETTAPFGMFGFRGGHVLTAWVTGGGRPNDVCVLSLNPRGDGQQVSNVVGWLGRSWNHDPTQHHFAFGYPASLGGGNYKYECTAESYANCGDGQVLGMGCNMTFGASGGPWVRTFKKFEAGSVNFVNGVVSGYDGCTGTFGQSFNGPRFTSNNIVPLCNAEGC